MNSFFQIGILETSH